MLHYVYCENRFARRKKEEEGGVSKRGQVAIRGSYQAGWGGTEDDAASDEVGRGGRGREMIVSPFTRHRDAGHRREAERGTGAHSGV